MSLKIWHLPRTFKVRQCYIDRVAGRSVAGNIALSLSKVFSRHDQFCRQKAFTFFRKIYRCGGGMWAGWWSSWISLVSPRPTWAAQNLDFLRQADQNDLKRTTFCAVFSTPQLEHELWSGSTYQTGDAISHQNMVMISAVCVSCVILKRRKLLDGQNVLYLYDAANQPCGSLQLT